MGAKKKGGGKKKGGKKGGGGEDGLTLEENNAMLEAMQQSMVAHLIRNTEDADKAKASEMEIRKRERELERNVKREQKIQMDIISDMTRQYKSVEEQLMNKINSLEQRKMENSDEKKRLEESKKALEDEIREISTSK